MLHIVDGLGSLLVSEDLVFNFVLRLEILDWVRCIIACTGLLVFLVFSVQRDYLSMAAGPPALPLFGEVSRGHHEQKRSCE